MAGAESLLPFSGVALSLGRRLERDLPFENAGAGGSGLRFRNLAGLLQRNGKRGVRERIVRREHGKRQSRSHGLFEAAGIAQCVRQPVMRFHVIRMGGDGGAIGASGFAGRAGEKQIVCALNKRVGSGGIGGSHGYLQDKPPG